MFQIASKYNIIVTLVKIGIYWIGSYSKYIDTNEKAISDLDFPLNIISSSGNVTTIFISVLITRRDTPRRKLVGLLINSFGRTMNSSLYFITFSFLRYGDGGDTRYSGYFTRVSLSSKKGKRSYRIRNRIQSDNL